VYVWVCVCGGGGAARVEGQGQGQPGRRLPPHPAHFSALPAAGWLTCQHTWARFVSLSGDGADNRRPAS
jgi:hypothetical protein